MNDLLKGSCDPGRIILLVIGKPHSLSVTFALTHGENADEAHKGKGNYAYAQIIRELMHRNPHFRVLALTATPGSKPEDVQELCDAMHISHIEIRDEFSSDLKQYSFDKVRIPMPFPFDALSIVALSVMQEIEQHIVQMSDEILQIRTLLAGLMEVPHSLVPLRSVFNLPTVSH